MALVCFDDLGVTRAALVRDGEVDMIFDRIQYTADAKNRSKSNFAADFLFGMDRVVKEATASSLFV